MSKIGEKRFTTEGYESKIIEFYNWKNCTILIDNKIILKNRRYDAFLKGNIKNPYHPSVFNVGYFGMGDYNAKIKGITTQHYKIWSGVMSRCYDKKLQKIRPTYKGVTVCEEWKCFQNFAEWFEQNYIEGFALDKDILVKGNKTYSPETCCFVPQEINTLLVKSEKTRGEYPIGITKSGKKYQVMACNRYIGVFNTIQEAFQAYKTAKELHIKEVADRWRGQITEEVYQALYKYKIEITD